MTDCKLKEKLEGYASVIDLDKNLSKMTQSFQYFQQQSDKITDKITEIYG